MPNKKIAKRSDKPRTNRLTESLLEQDEDLGLALDAALDAAEQALQKQAQGTIWAGKYEPLQLAALFKQHIETHLCEELLAIAEYGDYKHWLEAGKPEPSFDHKRKGAHITYGGPHAAILDRIRREGRTICEDHIDATDPNCDTCKREWQEQEAVNAHESKPSHRRYFAVVPGVTRMKARYIDVIGGHEKDHEGMDAAVKYAHKVLGKSVNVKLVPVSDTKPNVTITL
jgi:hypothetical protein